ncbi:hypothetical protein Spb1_18060 [Planctopirus ephydatiae]|jgi:hypothetical protein|uniref:Uncharacterized protein n=1 Tax=Planctopirus ephydatiae TaxID=2528019 RepID=A0A518GMU0_9PLAN|nr:hypothetical protein Spb1_18060 [Planctopirus ephydatiae]
MLNTSSQSIGPNLLIVSLETNYFSLVTVLAILKYFA